MDIGHFVLDKYLIIAGATGIFLALALQLFFLVRSDDFKALPSRRSGLGYSMSAMCASFGLLLLITFFVLNDLYTHAIFNSGGLFFLLSTSTWFVGGTVISYLALHQGLKTMNKKPPH